MQQTRKRLPDFFFLNIAIDAELMRFVQKHCRDSLARLLLILVNGGDDARRREPLLAPGNVREDLHTERRDARRIRFFDEAALDRYRIRRNHTERNGRSVRNLIGADTLEGMSEGVRVIEQNPLAAIKLVLLDEAALEVERRPHILQQLLVIVRKNRLHITLHAVDTRRARNDVELHDFA